MGTWYLFLNVAEQIRFACVSKEPKNSHCLLMDYYVPGTNSHFQVRYSSCPRADLQNNHPNLKARCGRVGDGGKSAQPGESLSWDLDPSWLEPEVHVQR